MTSPGKRRLRPRVLAVAASVLVVGTLGVVGITNALAATVNGAKIQLYDCNGTNAQKWTASNGELVNAGSGRCLDATGNSSANGTRLQIWNCGGAANQLWTLPS